MFRREYGRAVAVLVRSLGDISLAEEAVQDAFRRRWSAGPQSGVPPAPAGWIITTARNRAIDRLRREASRDARHAAALQLAEQDEIQEHDVPDERLRLIFTCCHPALAAEARVALTLQVARRARHRGDRARLPGGRSRPWRSACRAPRPRFATPAFPTACPEAAELPDAAGGGARGGLSGFQRRLQRLVRRPSCCARELCDEAIRLGRMLLELMPQEPEVRGLLALMLLIDARRAARIDAARRSS